MEHISFLTSTLSFLVLLLISSFTYFLSKKINFPYTVLLVVIGIFLVPLSNIGALSFIDHFKLTPDILFFIFLPALLFEASYKIKYKKLIKEWRAIGMMAIFGVTASSLIIAWTLYYGLPIIWFEIPFLVTLLFWVIISATDPVAVLAIFHTIGAPKRLSLLFEWESLFNDGTVVAVFIVVLWIILSWWHVDIFTIADWWNSFFTMIVWGMVFGFITGFVFSKLIWCIKNDEPIEILLTLISAHLTFLLAEMTTHYFQHILHVHSVGISGVVATVIAWIVMGNFWRYKITPRVEVHVRQLWEFLAFVSNSIVFILIGLILSDMNFSDIKILFIPMIIAIAVVAISRFVSTWLSLGSVNLMKWWEKIPTSWIHVLSWGSLRGSLGLMMVLLIPSKWHEDFEKLIAFQNTVGWDFSFTIRDFILVLTVGCILFSLMVKAPTIPYFMKKAKVNELSDYERFEYFEGMILMLMKVLTKLESMHKKGSLIKKEYKFLKKKYNFRLRETLKNFDIFLEITTHSSKDLIRRAINIHSLWAEKKYLKTLFMWNQIWERNFRYILRKIDHQLEELAQWEDELKKTVKWSSNYDVFQKIWLWYYEKRDTALDVFIRNRARLIVIKKVIIELEQLSKFDIGFKQAIFREVIWFYEKLYKETKKKLKKVMKEHHKITFELDIKLSEKSIFALEEKMIESMHDKWIITDKLYIKFKHEIQEEFYSDVKEEIEIEHPKMIAKIEENLEKKQDQK